MNRPKTPAAKQPESERSARSRRPAVTAAGKSHVSAGSAIRETVESVVIAFVLAFLFRTFEAEAFVIPTGSMAPTLMGRHREYDCPKCGHTYQVSASQEVNQDGVPIDGASPTPHTVGANDSRALTVVVGTCPMCRFTAQIGPQNPNGPQPSFKGDRILVDKFAYQLREPERWDVAVFKFPGEAYVNYIKRLVGRPNETVRIYHGDIFVAGRGQSDFEIQRKPPHKLLAMLQPVWDNDLTPKLKDYPFPLRWQPAPSDAPAGAWQPSADGRSFATDGTSPRAAWLHYRHLVPSQLHWARALSTNPRLPDEPIKPQLIVDMTAYNTSYTMAQGEARQSGPYPPLRDGGGPWPGPVYHPVGDLALACTLDTDSDSGEVYLALIKGGREFRCAFELATGLATLSISGHDMAAFRPAVETNFRGRGQHTVIFANCDQELRLWIDGRLVQFGGDDKAGRYPDLDNFVPTDQDLTPVRIGARGAAVRASRLRIYRDVYYLTGHQLNHTMCDYRTAPSGADFYSNSKSWAEGFAKMAFQDFPLAEDQFFMLGDNSAQSKDSRAWETGHFVHRSLMIGKAFFIYWPHSWDWPVPFFPNFGRMGFVR
jgi:signal peptidase I